MQLYNKLSLKNSYGILESWRIAALYSDITCNEISFLKHTENLLSRAVGTWLSGVIGRKSWEKMTSKCLSGKEKV